MKVYAPARLLVSLINAAGWDEDLVVPAAYRITADHIAETTATHTTVLDNYNAAVRITVYTAGAGNFTTQAVTKKIRVRMVGGGGGGGGAATSASNEGAGGGGSGGYAEKLFTVAGSTVYAYSVGGGGAGGVGNSAGTNGSNTTFIVGGVTVTAYGGTGGPVSGVQVFGGAGGIISVNGDVNKVGEDGGPGIYHATICHGGRGGSSMLGSGAPENLRDAGVAGKRNGDSATAGSGGGGAGAACASGGADTADGGAGGSGCIIVEEFP